MTDATPTDFRRTTALAGALYLVIIVAGVWSEAFVRAPLLLPDDPVGTAGRLRASLDGVRASIAADTLMLIADVGLAVLLFRLLRPVGPGWALTAMAFRLMQAAVLGANLLNLQAAVLLVDGAGWVSGAGETMNVLATQRLMAHAHGYDLGLVFFGINAVLTGALLVRLPAAPRWLGPLVVVAGAVYLVGSGVRLLAPQLSDAVAPAYVVPLLTESLFCLWLLWAGLGRRVTGDR